MPKESVLSAADKEAISIDKMIFHIILKDEAQPFFLDELEISDEQTRFFKNRLADSAQGRQYIFTSKDVAVHKLVQDIITRPNANFLKASKDLTDRFKTAHTNNTNDGVFVIALASIKKRKLVFLVKLDHKKVIQYRLKGNKALLKEVQNTFVEDKSAIQKVALIDINPNVVWDVLVYDRSKPSSITDFFRNFLSVNPRETESQLTSNAISFVLRWASENRNLLDPEQEPSKYKNRAIVHMWNINSFDTDAFIKSVIQDNDPNRRDQLESSLRDFLTKKGLAGQCFDVNRNALTKKTKKNVRQTAEGVKIEWTGEPQDHNISIPNEPNNNGIYRIIIETNSIQEIQ